MNTSVAEVLEALERSKVNVPKDWDYLATDEEVMFQVYEMEYMEKPLSAHLGVDKEVFPPLGQLEDDEVKVIIDKILDVWAVYHYFADLPEGLPVRIAYETLLSVWDEVVSAFPVGEFHFDFYDRDLEQYVDHKSDRPQLDLPF
jgi:hypothetical protein